MAPRQRHADLIARLHEQIQRNPGLYRWRLVAVAAVGYAVLALALAVGLGLPLLALGHLALSGGDLGLEHVYLVVLPGMLGVLVWRALWIRFTPPDGHVLRPEQAPELAARVEQLRVAAGVPPLKGIVIDGELNAAAASVPRAMGLGGHDFYLVLGLPVLRLLDPAELDAVIAHEFGHFGQPDQTLGTWIYRLRLSWARVLEALAARDGGGALLILFCRWYVPWFNAYSLALARHHEYGADAVSARVTSGAIAVSALTRMALAGDWLDRHFRPLQEARMRSQRQPPLGQQAELARALAGLPEPARLDGFEQRPAGPDDTHPSLAQRAQALGRAPALRPRGRAAAEVYLGEHAAVIGMALDRTWRESTREAWQARFDAAAGERQRLEELERHLDLDPSSRLEHARLVERLRPDVDPLPFYDAAHAAAAAPVAGHAALHLRRGALLLRRGQWESGLAELARAITCDGALQAAVARELDQARHDPHLPVAAVEAVTAMAQRYPADADDEAAHALAPHALPAPALDALARALAAEPRIARAWLACQPAADDGRTHYLVLVDYRGSVASEAAVVRRLQARLALPGAQTLFTGTDQRTLATRVRQACAIPVYERARG